VVQNFGMLRQPGEPGRSDHVIASSSATAMEEKAHRALTIE
jgi:hypothetical protein